MRVEIDQNSGFCFGVVYAIEMAEDRLKETGQLYCLGDIVHNNMEVERLEAMGLEIIDHDDLKISAGKQGAFINKAKLTALDIEASNGVIHVIDSVLLPPADTKRWVASRKAIVVRGVLYGLISLSDAKKRYGLSDEEFNTWVSAVAEHGIEALKVTALKKYRQPKGESE